jgi:hypothetical protein
MNHEVQESMLFFKIRMTNDFSRNILNYGVNWAHNLLLPLLWQFLLVPNTINIKVAPRSSPSWLDKFHLAGQENFPLLLEIEGLLTCSKTPATDA